ncbi:MAG: hypothetical protein PUD07_04130 [bacterium]|nr:hypothetical protein [bacterium]
MRKRFKGLLCFIAFLLILSTILFVFYFIYTKLNNNDGDIKITGSLSINFHDGNVIDFDKSKDTVITIINNGNEGVYYYIEFINLNSETDINYSLTDNNVININDILSNQSEIISSYIFIDAGEIQNYDLKFSSSSENTKRIEINIEEESLESNSFAETILKNDVVKDKPLTIVGKQEATTDEGLIEESDDFGSSYYFRGNTLNNNVLINNLKFKIVRINGDGSVKLVLDENIEKLSEYYEDGNYKFKETTIYSALNSWINENLGKYSSFLSNQKYCNDTLLNENTFYAYTRVMEDNIPSLICLSEKFTSKVALLTVDEVLFAGATINNENKSFYLYNENITSDIYLMTSAKLLNNTYYPFVLSTTGKIESDVPGTYLRSVRPVITIIKTAMVTGTGTIDDPYILIES